MSKQLEWHALYDDAGEGEPWIAYVEGHHDLFALAPTAEAEILKAFPCHESTIREFLDGTGGAALKHMWLVQTSSIGDQPFFERADLNTPDAFPVTGVRF